MDGRRILHVGGTKRRQHVRVWTLGAIMIVLAANGIRAEGEKTTAASPLLDQKSTDWQSLFDGRTLAGWKQIDYFQPGKVAVKDKTIVIGRGTPFTGIIWTGGVFRINYEIVLEAKRTAGHDFFCGLTVPFKKSHCSLIVGGWGGGMFGISSINGFDASENETGSFLDLKDNTWYRVRLRVTERKLEAWLDGEKLIDEDVFGDVIGLRPGEIESCVPLGLTTWETEGTVRNIRLRKLTAAEIKTLVGDE